MNKSFNYEVNKVLKEAEREMLELKHPYVGTEHLLLSLLKKPEIAQIAKKNNLTYELFRRELINVVGCSSKKSEVILYTPLLRLVIDTALNLAKEDNQELSAIHLMSSLISSDDGIALRILMGMNIDLEKLYRDLSITGTKTLDEIGQNLNKKSNHILVGREKELDNIIEILLRKNKNNPLLIGECGVGKSAIVYELARRIEAGEVPERLLGKQIISVDMASMLSNTKYRGEFETRLNNIIKEVMSAKNVILFIDEIHTIVKSGGGEGSIDAANILKPYLAYDDIKIIGATTINEYEKFIVKDKALSRRFERVMVVEPTKSETINILRGVKTSYEEHHGVKISDENICDIVECAEKYIFTNHNPDKSLDVLDYVCSRVVLREREENRVQKLNRYLESKEYDKALKLKRNINRKSRKCITHKDILSVIESMTNIKIFDTNRYKLVCQALDEKVVGQNIQPIKDLLAKKLHQNRVLGFLIRGEEHIGKCFTAQVIAEALEYNLIELDMLEFSSSTSINRLMGSDPGFVGYDDETIFDKIKYNPYSLILLKGIENASPKVTNLFKAIIENGKIKNSKGEIINFDNTIIIMTSNICSQNIGYNHKQDDKFIENVVSYNLISRADMEKYLEKQNVKQADFAMLDSKTNFKVADKIINEAVYNDRLSVI